MAGAILLAMLMLEAALTLWYGTPGAQGPLEIVDTYESPFVFRVRHGQGANNLGLRRADDSPVRPLPGTRRILSYGDSIAEGYRLPESATYAFRLEESLDRPDGPHYEVLNMWRGHSPTIHAFHIRADVAELAPRGVVLAIELVNDVSDEARVSTEGRDEDGLPREVLSHRYLVGWDGHLLAPLSFSGSFVERTKLYAKLSRWYGRLRHHLRPNPIFAADSDETFYSLGHDRYLLTRDALDGGFDRLFESLAGIHRHLSDQEVRFLLVILPSRYVYGDGPYRDSSSELLRRAEERAGQLGLPFVSLREAFAREGGAALFMDFCHPTADGNQTIARALEPILREW